VEKVYSYRKMNRGNKNGFMEGLGRGNARTADPRTCERPSSVRSRGDLSQILSSRMPQKPLESLRKPFAN